ncbi:hypothetical protein ACC738_38115, partial [Rhizobium ruizarguesonis]
ILGWTGDNGDPDNFMDTLLGCDAVVGNNRAQWCNKEFDDLMTKAKLTADVAERTKAYEQAQLIFKKGHHDLFSLGSSASRRPSPIR